MGEVVEVKNNELNEVTSELFLENIIMHAIKIPGVNVDRNKFLASYFVNEVDDINVILENGPVASNFDKNKLKKIAEKLILDRTTKTSIASFAMGIPGGLAMAATIPADVLQFYGMSLKLAQELSYLYGSKDIWVDGKVDESEVRNQLILYCGVMFGVSYAASGVRLLSTQLAKVAVKKITQKALTKTFYYPLIKSIGKNIGVKITKKTFANGVSKAVPIIGGVVSGTITFASMKIMADRLLNVLIEANYDYDVDKISKDIEIIDNIDEPVGTKVQIKDKEEEKPNIFHKIKNKFSNIFLKKEKEEDEDNFKKIEKLKILLDSGAITQEEYDQKKKELLDKY